MMMMMTTMVIMMVVVVVMTTLTMMMMIGHGDDDDDDDDDDCNYCSRWHEIIQVPFLFQNVMMCFSGADKLITYQLIINC